MKRYRSHRLAVFLLAGLALAAAMFSGDGEAHASGLRGGLAGTGRVQAALTGAYPVHTNITAAVFWVGEPAGTDNSFIDNIQSAWDDKWETHYGGYDDFEHRNGYFPAGFTPQQNPFYLDLPYNDFPDNGPRKAETATLVYWANTKTWDANQSMLKNRWVKLTRNGVTCYAQWEDAGPFKYNDAPYVFGSSQPANASANHAGMDVSPALRDCLAFDGLNNVSNKVDWQFVDDSNVPAGPWTQIVTTTPTDWSGPPSLTPATVRTTAPADLAAALTTTPQLKWTPPANALTGTTRYTVQLWDGDPAAGGRQLTSLSTTAFSLTVMASEGLLPGHTYYWNVLGCNGTLCSTAGAPLRFSTATATALTCGTPAPADIVSPASGVLGSSTPTFTWSGGACVTQYHLYLGSSAGSSDLYDSGALAGTVTSATIGPALPADGRTIHVRLWSQINGSWQLNEHTYVAGACSNPVSADITSPAGSSPGGGITGFSWGGGACVSQYWLYAGSSPGAADIFNSGPLPAATTAATLPAPVPADGRTIYVRLWSLVNGAWQPVEHSFLMSACASPGKADFINPAPGILHAGSQTFAWSGGACVTQYYLYIGSSYGAADLFASNGLPAPVTAQSVSALPVNGSTIYVRLWSQVSGTWQLSERSYATGP